MAQALAVKLDGNFKRNVENTLAKWGYEYKYSRQTIEIVKAPESAQARLSEIMIREFKLDIQIDSLAFAYFIYSFGVIDGFGSMPWKEREEIFKSAYGIKVSEATLKRWGAKLIERGLLAKEGARSCWRTLENRTRELVTGDEELEAEARAYFTERAKVLKENKDNKKSWGIAFNTLWNKYGCCYYYCKGFELAAYDEKIVNLFQEIYELVDLTINE